MLIDQMSNDNAWFQELGPATGTCLSLGQDLHLLVILEDEEILEVDGEQMALQTEAVAERLCPECAEELPHGLDLGGCQHLAQVGRLPGCSQ